MASTIPPGMPPRGSKHPLETSQTQKTTSDTSSTSKLVSAPIWTDDKNVFKVKELPPPRTDLPKSKEDMVKWMRELDKELKLVEDEVKRDEMRQRLFEEFRSYNGLDKIVASPDILADLKTRPAQRLIPTGLTGLDNILGGLVKKQLIVIAAPTKNGKTSFCMELTIRLKDQAPLFLPFEEPAEELIQKFIDRKEDVPLFYTPLNMTDSKLKWVEQKIIEAKVKYKTEVVFIDHLHFIVPFSAERQDLMIGSTMRELKRIAKEWNVVIFLIAHLKKTHVDREPDLEDLRDSSFIAQEADTVIMLWRTTKREKGKIVILNEVNVSIQANRRTGKTGNIAMKFEGGRFYEIDKHQEDNGDTDAELSSFSREWNGN